MLGRSDDRFGELVECDQGRLGKVSVGDRVHEYRGRLSRWHLDRPAPSAVMERALVLMLHPFLRNPLELILFEVTRALQLLQSRHVVLVLSC